MRAPLHVLPGNLVLPIVQGRLKGKRWIVGSSNHGCWLGSYEYKKRKLFEKHVAPGAVVFDLGAHVGFYTLLASVLVGEAGRVFAFEPCQRNLGYLRRHIELNRISNVEVIESAVTDLTGRGFFDQGKTHSMGRLTVGGTREVATLAIDDAVQNGIVSPPQLLKIDIEGGEMLALSGARQTLITARPTIFLSTHGVDIHRRCCRFLAELGYRLAPIGASNIDMSDEVLATPAGVIPA